MSKRSKKSDHAILELYMGEDSAVLGWRLPAPESMEAEIQILKRAAKLLEGEIVRREACMDP